MIISPHPDDETLGAGGSIFRFKKEGKEVYWLNVTDATEAYGWENEFVKKRNLQIHEIIKFYGFDGFINLQFNPAQLDDSSIPSLIQTIGEVLDKIEPDCIILPDYNDAHSDHKYVFEAGYACSKIFRRSYIKRILTMEILSETNFGRHYDIFKPNLYINITDYLEWKLKAAAIYDTEIKELPFPRSIEAIRAQAILRGTEAGTLFAEAFRVIKEIE